ncbi:MAG: hypothetical protein HPY61_10235 [Methanotrichaceae archaeon]|nr:hypothetical protein [Methanotrichaceae archaeon]
MHEKAFAIGFFWAFFLPLAVFSKFYLLLPSFPKPSFLSPSQKTAFQPSFVLAAIEAPFLCRWKLFAFPPGFPRSKKQIHKA